MTKSEQAVELFSDGFNCAQSVLAPFAGQLGLSEELALKIGCGFGGGVRNCEICGAVSGAVMVIGLRYGHIAGDGDAQKALCYQKTKAFTDAFRQKHGSIVCRELLGVDLFQGDGMTKAKNKGLFQTTCVEMIRTAVALLEEMGY